MGILSKIFGKKKRKKQSTSANDGNMQDEKNLIRIYDEYGREMLISRETWRDKMLPGAIQNAWNDSDELYKIIIQAIEDEFFNEVLEAAEHLRETDPDPLRSTVVMGIVYMKNNRLADAENILTTYIEKHGEDGVLLTNLAKVYFEQGDNTRTEKTLWHALELDPNQDNGTLWYESIFRERGGETAGLEAMRKIAELPGSWRAQLWLAREELAVENLSKALDLYKESISNAPRPLPADLLMMMTSDLGRNGYLKEIIEFVEPEFDFSLHGIEVGYNLINTHVDLGNLDAAKKIVDQLYSLNRPDWKEYLNFWESNIARARLANEKKTDEPLEINIRTIEGPLWMDGALSDKILASKLENAPKIAFLGSCVIMGETPVRPELQITDAQGFISRAIPIVLAENTHLTTNATASAMIPWMSNKGFAVMGEAYEDNKLCEIAENNDKTDFIAGIVLDISKTPWQMTLRLLDVKKREEIGELKMLVDSNNPGPGVEILIELFKNLILKQPSISSVSPPKWYCRPSGVYSSDYLLRLEQLLALFCEDSDSRKGGRIFGERAMIDGLLELCLEQPKNPTVHMLFVQLLRQMKTIRPHILQEYEGKIHSLQKDHAIAGKVGKLINTALTEILESMK